jgi:hypothetical protein
MFIAALLTISAEGVPVSQEAEPDIDLNASSNDPPLVHATMVDEKTSSYTTTYNVPAGTTTSAYSTPASAPGTTTTTTYTVPAPGGSTPGGGAPVNIGFLGRSPKQITCPYCAVTAITRPRDQIDCVTVLIAVIILLLFWPLFWIPFLIPVSTIQTSVTAMKGYVHSTAFQHAAMTGYLEHKGGKLRRLETNRSSVLPPFLYQLLTFCIRLFDTVL